MVSTLWWNWQLVDGGLGPGFWLVMDSNCSPRNDPLWSVNLWVTLIRHLGGRALPLFRILPPHQVTPSLDVCTGRRCLAGYQATFTGARLLHCCLALNCHGTNYRNSPVAVVYRNGYRAASSPLTSSRGHSNNIHESSAID
jgi:hypothetical protein